MLVEGRGKLDVSRGGGANRVIIEGRGKLDVSGGEGQTGC